MTHDQFAKLLDKVAAQLGDEVMKDKKYHGPAEFQQRVFDVLEQLAKADGSLHVKPTFHPHAF